MKLTDKQLERLKLRPDRVAAIRARRAEINRRRDERLYQTPITDRLPDVGPMENSTDDTRRDGRANRRTDARDGAMGLPDDHLEVDEKRAGRPLQSTRQTGRRRIFPRFLIALAYAAIVAAVVLAGNEFFKWQARGGHRVLIDRITQEARP